MLVTVVASFKETPGVVDMTMMKTMMMITITTTTTKKMTPMKNPETSAIAEII
jgi:hypothetical protein